MLVPLAFLFTLSCLLIVTAAVPEYYLDELCGQHLSLSDEPLKAISLKLTSAEHYDVNMNCAVSVTSDSNTRIVTTFVTMNIQSFRHCPGDFLRIVDAGGNETDALRVCGEGTPDVTVVSRSNNVTVRFVSDGDFQGTGFHIIMTQFHTGSCTSEEFACDNGRCIQGDLACDDEEHDNCGDSSDRCRLGTAVIVGIAIGSIVLFVITAALSVIVWYRVRLDKQDDGYSTQEEGSVFDMTSVAEPFPLSQSVLSRISNFFLSRTSSTTSTDTPPSPPSTSIWTSASPQASASRSSAQSPLPPASSTPQAPRAATAANSADQSPPLKCSNA